MSHELNLLIASELKQLDMLIEPRRPLIARSLNASPSMEDLDALSALLHSAYTSMERIMTHIAGNQGVHEAMRSKAFMWHTALLNALATSTDDRPAVISDELRIHLNEYLGFRHVFRHAYLHELQWSKMRPLVENLENVVQLFQSEVKDHLHKRP